MKYTVEIEVDNNQLQEQFKASGVEDLSVLVQSALTLNCADKTHNLKGWLKRINSVEETEDNLAINFCTEDVLTYFNNEPYNYNLTRDQVLEVFRLIESKSLANDNVYEVISTVISNKNFD